MLWIGEIPYLWAICELEALYMMSFWPYKKLTETPKAQYHRKTPVNKAIKSDLQVHKNLWIANWKEHTLLKLWYFFNCKVEDVEKIFIYIIFQVRENGSDCFILIHIVITGVQLP